MRLALASILLVSLSAFGNDIIKVTDGSSAYCKSKADVLRYETSAVYRPVSFTRGNDESKLTVEFLRCVQKGENFLFVRDTQIEKRLVKVLPGPFNPKPMNVLLERSGFGAVTYSSKGKVYFRGELKKNADQTWSQTIPVEMANYEVNTRGDYFFELSLSFKSVVKDADTGKIIDARQDWMGSYRVYVK